MPRLVVVSALLGLLLAPPAAAMPVPWPLLDTISSDALWPRAQLSLSVAPVTEDEVAIAVVAPPGSPWILERVDVAGRRLATLVEGVGTGAVQARSWRPLDPAGRPLRGAHFVRLASGGRALTRRVALR